MAKILSIRQTEVKIGKSQDQNLEGFEVRTETDTHFVGISNFQDCCEEWGYLVTEDEPEEFVGCELLHVCYTGELHGELFTRAIEEIPSLDYGDVYFVTFETDRGSFQIAAYNSHNGYYGHKVAYLKNGKELHEELI